MSRPGCVLLEVVTEAVRKLLLLLTLARCSRAKLPSVGRCRADAFQRIGPTTSQYIWRSKLVSLQFVSILRRTVLDSDSTSCRPRTDLEPRNGNEDGHNALERPDAAVSSRSFRPVVRLGHQFRLRGV
ncbi:hypothetical protein F5883DRAFT_135131 [Diaporthe sp. PMI_573]|nr:hypothetical protein F5883DRAFT_135131 [Diaporthaceae sp. PMI_573]